MKLIIHIDQRKLDIVPGPVPVVPGIQKVKQKIAFPDREGEFFPPSKVIGLNH